MFDIKKGTAYVSSEGFVSYEEMHKHADSIAAQIHNRSLVFFVATNTVESLEAYVGFLKHHIVPLMVSASLDTVLVNTLLCEYKPEYIWCPRSFSIPVMIKLVFAYGSYALYATVFATDITTDLNPNLALLLSTSGSTGSPKYIRLSYCNLESNARAIAHYQALVPEDQAITTLPFGYAYGLSIINSHLITGASVVLTEATMFDKEFWNLLHQNRVTNFGGVPYTYSILKRLRFEQMSFSCLRFISQAGGRLGSELHIEFARICEEKNIDFVIMYGQTEATARMSYLPAHRTSEHIDQVGIAIPGGRFELLADDGTLIATPNTYGELVYYGDNVALGYALTRKDLSKSDEWNGRLETGDIATFDEEGYLRIVGRKKRFLKIFGNRINLDEIEGFLLTKHVVAACIGQDDAMQVFVETPQYSNAFIENLITPRSIQLYLAQLTGLNSSAFSIRFVEALPRTNSGKTNYTELESLLEIPSESLC